MLTQLKVQEFDGRKKGDWLVADLTGVLYISMALTVLWILPIFGLRPYIPLGGRTLLALLAALSFIPSFAIVFVFRRNPMVIGPRRQFRYIGRWL